MPRLLRSEIDYGCVVKEVPNVEGGNVLQVWWREWEKVTRRTSVRDNSGILASTDSRGPYVATRHLLDH